MLSKNDAAFYGLLALQAYGQQSSALVVERGQVGVTLDEYILCRLAAGHWVLYVQGSDVDSLTEWIHNAKVAMNRADFRHVIDDLKRVLNQYVRFTDRCILVGHSRGAAICLSLADEIDLDDSVVTMGDPGLVQAKDDSHVTSLRNQFDLVYGLVGTPSGQELMVSKMHLARKGWWLSVKDIGGHTNYDQTLKDEAALSPLNALLASKL